MRWIATALLAALAVPPAALAATDWQAYTFPIAGFTVHFPAQPTSAQSAYRTLAGLTVPAAVYSVDQNNVRFDVTVADFSKSRISDRAAIDDAIKAAGRSGKVQVDVEARIGGQYGHELSVVGEDGSRAVLAIFFFGNRLYVLDGHAFPPDADSQSGLLIRFQQSLQFTR